MGFWDAVRDSLALVEVVVLRWLLVIMSSIVERQRVAAIEYLIAENRVLSEQLGERRLKFCVPSAGLRAQPAAV